MIYVILVHDAPQFFGLLVKRLADKSSYFVIHVDNSRDIEPFKLAVENVKNCYFTPERFTSSWGSFALVEATLHAFKFIKDTLRKRQRIILLSGLDYPIKSHTYINNYLKSHRDTIFIEYEAIPRKTWFMGGAPRFPQYNYIKNQLDLYGGSQWFSIPFKALSIIFRFLKLNNEFLEYYNYVRIPDESFFQTLFLNCGHQYIQRNLRNQNLHHIKWDWPFEHPRTMTLKDIGKLQKSKSLFARKFDPIYSKRLLQKLDGSPQSISKKEQGRTAILFLTDKPYELIREQYEKIKHYGKNDAYLIVTKKENLEPDKHILLYEHHYHKKMGYTAFDEESIIPGSTYFAVLYFSLLHPNYQYYWLIEDDVCFNGDWKHFFDEFEDNKSDLISSYFTFFHQAKHWFWWSEIHTQKPMDDYYKLRTFYPVCRFSKPALKFLDERLKNGDFGHGEVLVPTLLYQKGFTFYDIAKHEPPLIDACSNKAVGDENNGSFRYRPLIAPSDIKEKLLYHPLKQNNSF